METRGTWRLQAWMGLIAVLLSGCGGGNDDFGPTMKPRPPAGNGGAGAAASNPSAAVNPTDRVATSEKEAVDDVATQKNDVKTSQASDMPDPKGTAVPPVDGKPASSVSREGEEASVPVAKSAAATTPAPEKVEPAKKGGPIPDASQKAGQPSEPSPEVIHQPLSPEAHEWLMSKCRQAVAHDGQSVLTAVDLSKVSWHDLRNGQLTREFFGRSGLTTGLGIDPQGEWVVGAAEAGWVRLWTMETQTGLDRFARQASREAQMAVSGFDTEQGGVRALAISPTGDWFVTGGEDGSLRKCLVETCTSLSSDGVAETQTGSQRTVRLENKVDAHAGPVTALKISADGAWAVSGGTDQQVRLWDTKTWMLAQTWSDMPTQILDVGVSADGRVVAATGLDNFARWWLAEASETSPESASKEGKPATVESKTNRSAIKEPKDSKKDTDEKPKNGLEHPDLVLAVAVSSDGKQIATGCKDKLVRVWDLATGTALEKHDGSKEAVVEVRFLDQDRRLLFADRMGNVRSKPRVRRASGGDEDTPAPTERMYVFATPASALSPADPVAADLGNPDESSEIATLRTEFRKAESYEARNALRRELLPLLNPDHRDEQAEKAVQVAALEKQLAGSVSETIKADLKRQISKLKTAAVAQDKSERPKLVGTLADVFPKESLATSTGRSQTAGVQLSILGDGELLAAFVSPLENHRDDDEDERRRAATQPAQLWVWDFATQTPLRHWDDVLASLRTVVWLEATNHLVSLSGHAFSLSDGRSRFFGQSLFEPISAFGIAPDGRHLAVGFVGAAKTTSKVLRLLDAGSLQEQQSHEAFESLVTAVAFSPDGTSLAVAIRERQVHRLLVLDAKSLSVLATVEEAPHASSWLQAGSGEGRDRGLTTLLFSSDGRFLLTHGSYSSSDFRLTLWQKKGSKWSKEIGVNSKASQPIIDDSRSPAPVWFVGGRGSQLGAITAKGLGIVDTSNGRLLRSVERRDRGKNLGPLAWSADGTWLAQGDDAGNVTLWNLRTDKEAAIFPAQLGPVKTLALSHDGRMLATLGEENKMHLWNLDGWQPKNRVAAKPKTPKPAASSD